MILDFSPEDPYPLLSVSEQSYSLEKAHARQVDLWLGLEIDEVELSIDERPHSADVDQQLWLHLDAQSFLTPYTELREIVERLQPRVGQTFVDLGAGYGRLAHVLGACFPGVEFVGYEVVRERCDEAERLLRIRGYHQNTMFHQDLSRPHFQPKPAAFYFIYDYGATAAIRKTLEDLRLIAQARSITVVARGRVTRNLIDREHPWLSAVVKPDHFDRYSIYRSS